MASVPQIRCRTACCPISELTRQGANWGQPDPFESEDTRHEAEPQGQEAPVVVSPAKEVRTDSYHIAIFRREFWEGRRANSSHDSSARASSVKLRAETGCSDPQEPSSRTVSEPSPQGGRDDRPYP